MPRVEAAAHRPDAYWLRSPDNHGTAVLVFESAEAAQGLVRVIESEGPPTDAVVLDGMEICEVAARSVTVDVSEQVARGHQRVAGTTAVVDAVVADPRLDARPRDAGLRPGRRRLNAGANRGREHLVLGAPDARTSYREASGRRPAPGRSRSR